MSHNPVLGPVSPVSLKFEAFRLLRIPSEEDSVVVRNHHSSSNNADLLCHTIESSMMMNQFTNDNNGKSNKNSNNKNNSNNGNGKITDDDTDNPSKNSNHNNVPLMMHQVSTASSGAFDEHHCHQYQCEGAGATTADQLKLLAPAPVAASTFSMLLQAAQSENWDAVGHISDAFAADVFSTSTRNSAPHKASRRQLIELAQNEFESAYAVKNIKRRQAALLIVAYLFRARKLISEKAIIHAMYLAMNPNSSNNNNNGPHGSATAALATASSATAAVVDSHNQQYVPPPPLYALLAVARALTVCSGSFEAIGMQHLPAIISKLCSGMLTCTPSAEQHAELCDSIRVNSAVLHGFRA